MRNRGPRQHVDRRNRDLERENERLKEELEKERREKEELHRPVSYTHLTLPTSDLV